MAKRNVEVLKRTGFKYTTGLLPDDVYAANNESANDIYWDNPSDMTFGEHGEYPIIEAMDIDWGKYSINFHGIQYTNDENMVLKQYTNQYTPPTEAEENKGILGTVETTYTTDTISKNDKLSTYTISTTSDVLKSIEIVAGSLYNTNSYSHTSIGELEASLDSQDGKLKFYSGEKTETNHISSDFAANSEDDKDYVIPKAGGAPKTNDTALDSLTYGVVKIDTTAVNFNTLDSDSKIGLTIENGIVKFQRILEAKLSLSGKATLYNGVNQNTKSLTITSNNWTIPSADTIAFTITYSGGVSGTLTGTIGKNTSVTITCPDYTGNTQVDYILSTSVANVTVNSNNTSINWLPCYYAYVINSSTLPTSVSGAAKTWEGFDIKGKKTFTASNGSGKYYWVLFPKANATVINNYIINGMPATWGLGPEETTIEETTYIYYRSAGDNMNGASIVFTIV